MAQWSANPKRARTVTLGHQDRPPRHVTPCGAVVAHWFAVRHLAIWRGLAPKPCPSHLASKEPCRSSSGRLSSKKGGDKAHLSAQRRSEPAVRPRRRQLYQDF